MPSNTFKTCVGFLRSIFKRRKPFKTTSVSVGDIYNYVKIDNLFATSGQPDECQFRLIRDAGYETVINLAPRSVLENSLKDEGALLAELGMQYVHIPVDFMKPSDDDFAEFVRSLEANAERKVWVHCAANMRVSAFTYRYRRAVLGQNDGEVRADLDKIWEPFGVWKKFVAR
jgi:protein tyrosine phosphatase (PTP) superfamily phosphohydrolase (DUF442 family)